MNTASINTIVKTLHIGASNPPPAFFNIQQHLQKEARYQPLAEHDLTHWLKADSQQLAKLLGLARADNDRQLLHLLATMLEEMPKAQAEDIQVDIQMLAAEIAGSLKLHDIQSDGKLRLDASHAKIGQDVSVAHIKTQVHKASDEAVEKDNAIPKATHIDTRHAHIEGSIDVREETTIHHHGIAAEQLPAIIEAATRNLEQELTNLQLELAQERQAKDVIDNYIQQLAHSEKEQDQEDLQALAQGRSETLKRLILPLLSGLGLRQLPQKKGAVVGAATVKVATDAASNVVKESARGRTISAVLLLLAMVTLMVFMLRQNAAQHSVGQDNVEDSTVVEDSRAEDAPAPPPVTIEPEKPEPVQPEPVLPVEEVLEDETAPTSPVSASPVITTPVVPTPPVIVRPPQVTPPQPLEPQLPPQPLPEPQPLPQPEPKPQPLPTPQPLPQPEPEPQPLPEPEPLPQPEPEPQPLPEPQPSPEPEPVPEATDDDDDEENTADESAIATPETSEDTVEEDTIESDTSTEATESSPVDAEENTSTHESSSADESASSDDDNDVDVSDSSASEALPEEEASSEETSSSDEGGNDEEDNEN